MRRNLRNPLMKNCKPFALKSQMENNFSSGRAAVFLCLFATMMLAAGCSKPFWTAKFYMLKAENLMSKAALLKSKKFSYAERIPYYREACSYFLAAYREDSSIFTLGRIREAGDSCWRSGDVAGQGEFAHFEGQYAKRHPKEYEYGETDAPLPEG